MESQPVDTRIARLSAAIYLPVAFGAALVFLLGTLLGDFPVVARAGGTVWVGLLSLIISMPLVTAQIKRRLTRRQP